MSAQAPESAPASPAPALLERPAKPAKPALAPPAPSLATNCLPPHELAAAVASNPKMRAADCRAEYPSIAQLGPIPARARSTAEWPCARQRVIRRILRGARNVGSSALVRGRSSKPHAEPTPRGPDHGFQSGVSAQRGAMAKLKRQPALGGLVVLLAARSRR